MVYLIDKFLRLLGSNKIKVAECVEDRAKFWVYLGVKTCEVFLCFIGIVRVRVYYFDFFVFFVLRHW